MLEERQIEQLNSVIKEGYGSPEHFARRLDEMIFMLHYLEEGIFTPREIRSAADLLRELGEVLR